MITISEYLGFFITTTLLFGAAFEMPLILVILGMIGVVNAEMLRAKRKIAIMLIAVLSAVITPPDAISMLAMIAPLLLLYELSIVLVKILGNKRKAAEI
jgi:sec-independent protein translocase protein TatC